LEIMPHSRCFTTPIGSQDERERLAVGLLEAAMPLP
jgi:hypothetical protein